MNNDKSDSKLKKLLLKNAFPLFGLGALIWFLIRVIPKPSRAAYPCMKVAAPMASSFVLWLLGLSGALLSFKKMKGSLAKSSYLTGFFFLAMGISFTFYALNQDSIISYAGNYDETVTANLPIGVAKGINPGRVVWVWDRDATNENCTNSYSGQQNTPADENDDGWFLNKNNDQNVIDGMLSDAIKSISSQKSDAEAWEAIFKYFNKMKNGNDVGYTAGEKIFIKINATSTWGRGQKWGNITNNNEHMRNGNYGMAETSPQLILALLRQLVNVYNVPQEDISVGDPMKYIYNNSYYMWYNEFPNVHYIANTANGDGREAAVKTADPVIFYSDKGNAMPSAISDKIYTVMNDASYLINVPTLKAHARAGITLFAKNHFGSHTRSSAEHLHTGLVAPENDTPIRTDSGMYRVQVDLMGHKKFGGNQVLFLLDALWAGSEAIEPPTKWDMAPFNGDWTSSIFVSQDPVAIESVAFDFLYTEYDGSSIGLLAKKNKRPHMKGTTDYLRQAASSDYWPEGVSYDPENDGTPISSLGVNEHWNNADDKEYTRNLGTGNGIELVFIDRNSTDVKTVDNSLLPNNFVLEQNYPNPFNPTTNIQFSISERSSITLQIFDMLGKEVKNIALGEKSSGTYQVTWDATDNFGSKVVSGNYIYRLTVNNGQKSFIQSKKMTLMK